MATYPWTVLGISKTTDEGIIKSAYARKLKLTRPDDDPIAFQALVEARDIAIRRARSAMTKKKVSSIRVVPAVKETQERDNVSAMADDRKPILITETPPKRAKKPKIIRLDDHGHPTIKSREIVKAISSYLVEGSESTAYEKVDDALASLRTLPIDEKISMEAKLLRAVETNLSVRENRPAREFPDNAVYDDLCRLIIVILNEVYDWTQNDRRVRGQLGWGSEDFVDQLQSRINNSKPLLVTDVRKTNSYWWLGPVIFLAWLILKSLGAFSTGN
jgi:hypothetical protein